MTPARTPRRASGRSLGLALLLCAAGASVPLRAQEPVSAAADASWNGPRTLDFVRRARELRRSTAVDSAFRDYSAEADGYVYFFIDRPDSDERTLVKADQVAIDLFWKAPDRTLQRVVGLRDEKVLPTNIRYHMDHLTVVQDDFGDWIRMGDGDEVERVLHPLGPNSEDRYDFRLADSLSIRYGGQGEQVRVYEIRVRPRNPQEPGFIGSVFLDRDQAAVVRMNFTFTPASYVDPYLDYIRISMDNSLWDGRYWLPYRQEAEIRREMPALDFLSGSIIRGRFEIRGYAFNVGLPDLLFAGSRRVETAPEEQLAAFQFERGLFDDLDEQGLEPVASLEEVRAQARELVEEDLLSGLDRYRLFFRSFSDAFRYNRAEGFYVGAGVRLPGPGPTSVRTSLGWAFGRGSGTAEVALEHEGSTFDFEGVAYWDRLRDLGPVSATSSVVNTLGSSFLGRDYIDPWFVRGGGVTVRKAGAADAPSLSVNVEDHRSAMLVIDEEDVRPVRAIDEGTLTSATVRWPLAAPLSETGVIQGLAGRLEERTFASLIARSLWTDGTPDDPVRLRLDAAAGVVTSDAPVQYLFALGGRGTVPGFAFRELTGTRFGLVDGSLTVPVYRPLVGVRILGAVGGVGGGIEDRVLPAGWEGARDEGVRAAVGGGLSLLWDVLYFDLYRGLGEHGKWEFIFSVTPRLSAWL